MKRLPFSSVWVMGLQTSISRKLAEKKINRYIFYTIKKSLVNKAYKAKGKDKWPQEHSTLVHVQSAYKYLYDHWYAYFVD